MRFEIPFAYEMYGMIPVEADSIEEAKEKARAWLEEATVAEMAGCAEYLQDSEEIDEEGIARDENGDSYEMEVM